MSAQRTTERRSTKQRQELPETSDLDLKIAQSVKLGLPIVTLACAIIGGVMGGAPMVVLALAGSALATGILIFWSSLRTLAGETKLSGADAYALGTPRAEEEQKRAVLRALKDLEFERSVGKISDEDYRVLAARYRSEAKRLLRLLDAEEAPQRARVEELVNKRLRREGLFVEEDEEDQKLEQASDDAENSDAENDDAENDDAENDDAENDDAKSPSCAACGTINDIDAVFCKKCGARLVAEQDESQAQGDEEDVS